jgi:periplasmic protein TonB
MLRIFFKSLGLLLICAACGVCDGPPKKVTQAEALSAVVTKVAPEYPPIARQLHISGSVMIEVDIAATGSVDGVSAISGNPVLTKPAMDTLKKWKFKPFTANGAPVKAQTQIAIEFKP